MKKFLLILAVAFLLQSCLYSEIDDDIETKISQTSESGDELYFNWLILHFAYLHNEDLQEFEYYNRGRDAMERIVEPDAEKVFGLYSYIQDSLGEKSDRYTYYVPPASADDFNQQISTSTTLYGDLGMLVRNTTSMDEAEAGEMDSVYAERIVPGGPADLAGIQQKDRILLVNEVSLIEEPGNYLHWKFDEMNRFEVGESVELYVLRPGGAADGSDSVFSTSATSAQITYKTVWVDSLISGSIRAGIVDVDGFVASAFEEKSSSLEFREALEALAGYDTLIIDFRENPGGLVLEALDMLEAMLPPDELLFNMVSRLNAETLDTTQIFSTEEGDPGEGKTFILLSDYNSASASEMILSSLKVSTNCIQIGERSRGKGVGQSLFDSPYGGVAAVTRFQNYDSNWETWHKTGLVPDVETSYDYAQKEAWNLIQSGEDLQALAKRTFSKSELSPAREGKCQNMKPGDKAYRYCFGALGNDLGFSDQFQGEK